MDRAGCLGWGHRHSAHQNLRLLQGCLGSVHGAECYGPQAGPSGLTPCSEPVYHLSHLCLRLWEQLLWCCLRDRATKALSSDKEVRHGLICEGGRSGLIVSIFQKGKLRLKEVIRLVQALPGGR